tara:strand:+ start:859 stop:1098 length:240 start_codon:yes stop_codon:yes gene_type:complete
MKTVSAVEWLAEKYNYITWMRNRDEMSAGTADKWREDYLEQAKEMEREQIVNAVDGFPISKRHLDGEEYYKETYGGNNE